MARADRTLQFPDGFRPRAAGGIGGAGFSRGASLSGNERNRLFANDGNGGFYDVSSLSGADSRADGRAAAWLDYDRDGRLDLVTANANAPTMQVFRNESGAPDSPSGGNGFVAVRVLGGNAAAVPSESTSSRDAIGARIETVVGRRRLSRVVAAGEGLAAQSSATTLVGLGEANRADTVRVRWPSGRTAHIEDVPSGALVVFREGAPPGLPSVRIEPYPEAKAGAVPSPSPTVLGVDVAPSGADLRMFVTMATWCAVCRAELPQLALIRDAFSWRELDILAVPVDEKDSRAELEKYVAELRPSYEMLYDRSAAERAEVKRVVEAALRRDALPSTITTRKDGSILDVRWGLPTISDVRGWLTRTAETAVEVR